MELVPNVLGFLSFGAYQQHREGDPDAWATQVLHIICPGLHPGENTATSPHVKDVCKRDLQALGINTDSWEVTATDRDAWRHTVKVGLSQYEETQRVKAEEKKLYKNCMCSP